MDGRSTDRPYIEIASIILALLSILNVIGGSALLLLSLTLGASVGGGTHVNLEARLAAFSVLGITLGVLGLLASHLLWRSRKLGGYIAIGVVVVGILSGFLSYGMIPGPTWLFLLVTGSILNIMIIVLIVLGWNSLQ
ncbi:MAG: hypothetical protein F7B19_03820 [Desulfurococcales archaeon]|nr:hypothetical protein [Desulfurococcales archaeon]